MNLTLKLETDFSESSNRLIKRRGDFVLILSGVSEQINSSNFTGPVRRADFGAGDVLGRAQRHDHLPYEGSSLEKGYCNWSEI